MAEESDSKGGESEGEEGEEGESEGEGEGGGNVRGKGLKFSHTPLEYVSSNHPTKGIKISSSIARIAFKNVVETSVQVCGHEGVWHEGVFMILAEGEEATTWRRGGEGTVLPPTRY